MAKSNKIAGTILLVFFGWAFKMALSFPPRAMYFPVFVTGTGIVLSFLLLVSGFLGKREQEETAVQGEGEKAKDAKGRKMAAVMLALMILYVIGMQTIGFCVSTLIFLIGSMLINYPGKADKKALMRITIVSAGITVLIYLVFKMLLYVPLPTGFLI